MTRDELIAFWCSEAERDFEVMQALFEKSYHTWALFVGHLVLEKFLKALYVVKVGPEAPRSHHLLKLARDCGMQPTPRQEEALLEITTFNLRGRYPDFKLSFHRKATRTFTQKHLDTIVELKQWIMSELPV